MNDQNKTPRDQNKLPAKAVYELVAEPAEPTDYQRWRDALQMSATIAVADGAGWNPRAIRENAEMFHEWLVRGAPGPPVPDCPHCGADSSMDHDEDCPNAEQPTEAQARHGVALSEDAAAAAAGVAKARTDLSKAIASLIAESGTGDPEDGYERYLTEVADLHGLDIETHLNALLGGDR